MTERDYHRLTEVIRQQLREKDSVIIAVDGRCGSGKTTLALRLQKEFAAAVFHMDDFFLRPEQRTAERLAQPGENVDHERFLTEVLLPLHRAETAFCWRPYRCGQQALGDLLNASAARLNIVEGSYSCHPELWPYYDLRVFLTVAPDVQLQRIIRRSGAEKAAVFTELWIPLEEAYFRRYDVQTRCTMRLEG